MVAAFAIAIVLFSMGMVLARAFLGPKIFDRLLAANIFGTHIVILIALLAYWKQVPELLDVALVYAFLNFVGTIGLLRYVRYGSFRKTGRRT